MVSDPNIILLKRGQRISLKDNQDEDIKIVFSYSKLFVEMEIDPYAFLLDKKGLVTGDDDLIYFGKNTSKCGGVKFIDYGSEKNITLNLNQVSPNVEKISIAYSIYGDIANNNFSKVHYPTIRILSGGKDKMKYIIDNLLIETTIVAIELYRYNNEWKINTVGAGYRDGLKRLCENFGLKVDN